MNSLTISTSAVIHARPEKVYSVIADYRTGHPAILPKENFADLQVESGGYGAGTIIRFRSRVLGTERGFHQIVSEPEPGRVLVEKDIQGPVTTTFTVTPVENGQGSEGLHSQVKITTEMETSPGIQGLVERLVLPRALKPVYKKELEQLSAYVQSK